MSSNIVLSSTNSLLLQSDVDFLSLFAGQQEFGTNKRHRRRVCYVFFRNSRPAALFLLTGWLLKTLTLSSEASAPVDIYSCSVKDIPVVFFVFPMGGFTAQYFPKHLVVKFWSHSFCSSAPSFVALTTTINQLMVQFHPRFWNKTEPKHCSCSLNLPPCLS